MPVSEYFGCFGTTAITAQQENHNYNYKQYSNKNSAVATFSKQTSELFFVELEALNPRLY